MWLLAGLRVSISKVITGLLAGLSFSSRWPKTSVPCPWASYKATYNMAPCSPRPSAQRETDRQKKHRRWQLSHSLAVILEVTSCHFSHILFIRSNSLGLPTAHIQGVAGITLGSENPCWLVMMPLHLLEQKPNCGQPFFFKYIPLDLKEKECGGS